MLNQMTREDAKKVKCDFVNMSQTYNGYEITDMWNMMVDQLFDSMDPVLQYFFELKEIPTPVRNMVHFAEAPIPISRPIENRVPGVEPEYYTGIKTEYYQRKL